MPFSKLRLTLAVAALATALPAAAQFARPEQAVKYRQSAMAIQAAHFGRIAAMANGRVPFDAAAAQANAELVLTMSKLPFVAFVEGTDKVGNTKAKPEVWTNRADFDAKAKAYQDEAAKLAAAARAGNLDQIKAAVGAVGQSCKSCHDAYQVQ